MMLQPLPARRPNQGFGRRTLDISVHCAMERNLRGFPFPSQAEDSQRLEVLARAEAAIAKLPPDLRVSRVEEPSELEHLVEEVLPQEAGSLDDGPGTAFYAGRSEKNGIRYAIGINQGGHIMVWMRSDTRFGWEFAKCLLEEIAEALGRYLEWAYRPDIGYLCSDLSRVGAAMTLSLLVHLPGLALCGLLPATARALRELGFGLRAACIPERHYRAGPLAYEDGALPAAGNRFFLQNLRAAASNQSETLLFGDVYLRGNALIEHEWNARKRLIEDDPRRVTDLVSRARALLRNAYLLTFREAMDAVSMIQFGSANGILPVRTPEALEPLWLEMRPSRLRRRFGGTDVTHRLRAARATLVREAFKATAAPRPRRGTPPGGTTESPSPGNGQTKDTP